MISIHQAQVQYHMRAGAHRALDPVDLTVPRGGSCVIIGPTGCGKSTLLSMLAGLLRPTVGSVAIEGDEVTAPRLSTSLILQQHGLFPWKNALKNVELGLTLRGIETRRRRRIARELMEELGIWDVRDSYPGQLSGGQRQRVAIARALATDPDLLLMDEPFSALDTLTRESLQNLLLTLRASRDLTTVLVTHSIEEAVFLGDIILVLSGRPGRVLEVVENPEGGSAGYRLTETFHRHCVRIRELLEENR